MLPKLNRKRALFVLTKIDEILAWEARKEAERDTRFVELGRYLCEVRAAQYWRLENLKSFDEFLERRFPESRRKAYYLMSIHEHLPPQARRELREVGVNNHRPTIRACIAVARILAHCGARARWDDEVFRWVCHDVFNADTAKVTRGGHPVMPVKVDEVIRKACSRRTNRSSKHESTE